MISLTEYRLLSFRGHGEDLDIEPLKKPLIRILISSLITHHFLNASLPRFLPSIYLPILFLPVFVLT